MCTQNLTNLAHVFLNKRKHACIIAHRASMHMHRHTPLLTLAQAMHALEALASRQPTSSAAAHAMLNFASRLLLGANSSGGRPATSCADGAASSGGSKRQGDGGAPGSAGPWYTAATQGWLSWVLPLLAGQLVRAQPAAPPEVRQAAVAQACVYVCSCARVRARTRICVRECGVRGWRGS